MDELVGIALELGAEGVAGWSDAERAVAAAARRPSSAEVARFRRRIEGGRDPLGEAFVERRPARERRARGATYTPAALVHAMVAWAAEQGTPARIVDPGAGSARFAVAAGRRFPDARIAAIEVDPIAAVLARGHIAAAGMAARAEVTCADYCTATLAPVDGRTLFIGNPPYVRHHDIDPALKAWLTRTAAARGLRASQLAGLHVHFFLATAQHAAPGDIGALVTAAEWLDVNYGALVRELLLDGLGGRVVAVIDPVALPFPDAATTAAIAGFVVGDAPERVLLRHVDDAASIGALDGAGRRVPRPRLEQARRWSPLTRPPARAPRPDGVEVGALFRVHRGQVTGANAVWIAGAEAEALPRAYLKPTVTRARELIAAAPVLADAASLRCVVDLPVDLGEPSPELDAFLDWARSQGAADSYIARHRRAWWAVGLREPAPILATYMARRPPVFVRNLARAHHLNIAHGLYPRRAMSDGELDDMVARLNVAAASARGRIYAGGLHKFEPREMESIII